MTTYVLSIVAQGRDSASGPLSRVSSALGNMGQIAGGIIGAGLFINLGNQILQFGATALKATADAQTLQIGLEGLVARELRTQDETLGMAQALAQASPAAANLLSQIRMLAIQSPYRLGTVQETFRLAMAFGFASDEAVLFTEAILNMAAGTGASNEMLSRMSYNLAQIRLQGKVTAVDVRQLALAGFDLVGALRAIGAEHGVVIETIDDFNKAIEDGKLKWEDFAKDFAKYADQEFGGAAKRMSMTLEGLKSTFSDVFALSMPTILGPAVEKITGLLQRLMQRFIDFTESGVLEEWGQAIADSFWWVDVADKFFETFFRQLDTGESVFESFRIAIANTFGIDAANMFIRFAEEFEKMIGKIRTGDISGIVEGILDALKNIDWGQALLDMIDAVKAVDWGNISNEIQRELSETAHVIEDFIDDIDWDKVEGDIKNAINDIDWNGIGLLIHDWLVFAFEGAKTEDIAREEARKTEAGIRDGIGGVNWVDIAVLLSEKMAELLAGAISGETKEEFQNRLTETLVGSFFEALGRLEIVRLGIQTFMDGIKSVIFAKLQEITTNWSLMWMNVWSTAFLIWQTIVLWISTKVTEIQTWIDTKLNEIKTSWNTNWLLVLGTAVMIWQTIVTWVLTKVSELRSGIETTVNNIKTVMATKWGEIKTTILTAANLIKAGAAAKFDEMRTSLETKMREIAKMLFDRAQGWLQQIIRGTQGMAAGVIAQLNAIIAEIQAGIADIIINVIFSVGRFPEIPQGGGGGGGGGGCFIAGTPVLMADRSTKPIELVRVGDRIISRHNGANVVTAVTETFAHAAEETSGYLVINRTIGVTGNHMMLLAGGEWTRADSLEVGSVLTGVWFHVAITSIERVEASVPVYNLHVDHDCHNYYVHGVCAHNWKNDESFFNPLLGDGGNNRGATALTPDPLPAFGGAGGENINIQINVERIASEIDLDLVAAEVARRIKRRSGG